MWVLTSALTSIISGIISGIIASVILNKYYWSLKPNLLISDFIAKNNKNEYRIKIVNMSKFYITNIFIQVQLVTISIWKWWKCIELNQFENSL